MRYIAKLERKVQMLQTEATTMCAQLALLQRDTNGLTTENSELKLQLQTMEQHVHLQDGGNDDWVYGKVKVVDGKMVFENALDARLDVAFNKKLSLIGKSLFGQVDA